MARASIEVLTGFKNRYFYSRGRGEFPIVVSFDPNSGTPRVHGDQTFNLSLEGGVISEFVQNPESVQFTTLGIPRSTIDDSYLELYEQLLEWSRTSSECKKKKVIFFFDVESLWCDKEKASETDINKINKFIEGLQGQKLSSKKIEFYIVSETESVRSTLIELAKSHGFGISVWPDKLRDESAGIPIAKDTDPLIVKPDHGDRVEEKESSCFDSIRCCFSRR